VASGLSAPQAICALVLGIAGLAKLRSPGTAAAAVSLPVLTIRLFSLLEVGLCAYALVVGGRLSAGAMAVLFAAFAVLSLRLAARGEACGCFGRQSAPASPGQAILSAALAAVCLAAAIAGAPGASGFLGGGAGAAIVTTAGVLAAAHGLVLAYTQLPEVWGAWTAS
jgi:hypothetical protein